MSVLLRSSNVLCSSHFCSNSFSRFTLYLEVFFVKIMSGMVISEWSVPAVTNHSWAEICLRFRVWSKLMRSCCSPPRRGFVWWILLSILSSGKITLTGMTGYVFMTKQVLDSFNDCFLIFYMARYKINIDKKYLVLSKKISGTQPI